MLSRMCNFYPRPPRGGRLIYQATTEDDRKFLSTPSARRATYKRTELEPSMDISIHALREEGDRRRERRTTRSRDFYPRPPRGGRHEREQMQTMMIEFLSTPSARRATGHDRQEQAADGISIHALREEGDPRW